MSSKIFDDMSDGMRRRHFSIRTERSYFDLVKRFVLHFKMKTRDEEAERYRARDTVSNLNQ